MCVCVCVRQNVSHRRYVIYICIVSYVCVYGRESLCVYVCVCEGMRPIDNTSYTVVSSHSPSSLPYVRIYHTCDTHKNLGRFFDFS